nr:hypothetical protein [Tanacetum cinerariifolium]
MVNTRTDADLSAAVQNALQTLLPQIRAEIREEFRTSSGPLDAGGNPPSVTIHTWLERFNKQKPHSFEKATALERLKREYHSIRQTNTETSTEFIQRFLRLAVSSEQLLVPRRSRQRTFSGVFAGLPLIISCVCRIRMWLKLPMLLATMKSSMRGMMMTLSDQTSGRRVVIGICRPLSRVVTGTTVIITTVMDQTGEVVVTTTAVATTTTLAVTTGIPVMGVTREIGVSSLTDLTILVPSSPGVPLSATPTQFALLVDINTQESVVELLADKKPGASGRVFAITEGHAANTSGTITGTLSIYRHAVFMLFDMGATHSVISFAFASRVTTTPMLLDHVLCRSTPMQDSVRITYVYRNLLLQFDDKIRAINAHPLNMCEFDIILGR